MASQLLGDYAYLSDCHAGALVGGTGSVDWLCLPRFDAASVFAALLDPEGGHWWIRPAGDFETRRRYLPGTLVLETQFETPTGTAMLTDALVLTAGGDDHGLGGGAPHALVRVVEATRGTVSMDAELMPRPEYGLVRPRLRLVPGAVEARGGSAVLLVSGPEPVIVEGDHAYWEFEVAEGQRVGFALQYAPAGAGPLQPWAPDAVDDRLADTIGRWQGWSARHESYTGPWQEAVRHSGRVLKGLTYQPTGAMVAAPTTSLSEMPGGANNWDYRYAWARDLGPTMNALWVAACPTEAGHLLSWALEAAGARRDGQVAAIVGIGGEHDLAERELAHLAGWRDSAPVRVGNSAWSQSPLGIYGAVLDAVHRLHEHLDPPDGPTRDFLVSLADSAAGRWTEPDHGVWELRGEARQFLHSKLMCWVALDRAVALAPWLGREDHAEGWAAARLEVRTAILEQGWSEEAGAYTQVFGEPQLDASSLMLAITGFLPASDPRMRSTVSAVAAGLSAPCGLLYRFVPEPTDRAESTFVLCTYWLVECLALAGEVDRAREVFERVSAYANDVGLLSEQVDPMAGELMGNFPLALSHVGLVNAAWAIASAEAMGVQPSPEASKQ